MRILYADNALATIASIEVILGRGGFNVYSTDDAEEAIDLGKLYDYDLLLLGDVTGAHRVLQALRIAKCKTPILRFSTGPDGAVAALDAGADDYLIRPSAPEELIARIHAITRRARGHAQSLVTVGPLVLNLTTKTVALAALPLHLTGKEYQMLELLALRKGSLITKEMFLNHLYGGMDEPEIKIIDVFICKLRRKLGEHFALIETVWGRGYILRDPNAAVESPSLAPELREREGDRGVDFVPQRTWSDQREKDRLEGRIKGPSLVPLAGADAGRK